MIFKAEKERIKLQLTIQYMGSDLNVTLTGGTKPHLGSVAVAARCKGAAKNQRVTSISILTIPGHREDELTAKVARSISERLDKNCVVSCGIHLEEITPHEIGEVEKMSMELADRFIKSAGS